MLFAFRLQVGSSGVLLQHRAKRTIRHCFRLQVGSRESDYRVRDNTHRSNSVCAVPKKARKFVPLPSLELVNSIVLFTALFLIEWNSSIMQPELEEDVILPNSEATTFGLQRTPSILLRSENPSSLAIRDKLRSFAMAPVIQPRLNFNESAALTPTGGAPSAFAGTPRSYGACKSCARSKLFCGKNFPCDRCLHMGIECVMNPQNTRKRMLEGSVAEKTDAAHPHRVVRSRASSSSQIHRPLVHGGSEGRFEKDAMVMM